MGTIIRGIKNAFRNLIRTGSIVLILAVSISMSLIMFMAMKTVQTKIDSIKSSIGNFVTVSPAGIRGFEGGGELLTDDNATAISSLDHVVKVVKTINGRLTTDTDTNLKSAVEPGSFGRRQNSSSNDNEVRVPEGNAPQNMTMPIMVTGTNDLSVTANLNVSKLDITSGEKFDDETQELVALVGTELATKNSLSVGSTFQAYSKDIKVVGIFDGGNTFANATAIMPIKVLQNISDQAGEINSITVEADSIDNVEALTSEIKSKLGDKVDVSSQQDSSQNALEPLENIKTISLYSLIGALIAGSVIIFLTMVMIVRERRREIGVLKAIGASNSNIVTQFTVESLVLTLTSSVVGIILGLVLSNPILNVLVNNAQSSTESTGQGGGAGRAMMRFGEGIIPGARNTLSSLHATVGYEIIFYGLLAAVIIAIIGSAIPSYI
ncbi:MAG: FtsX-like permease family protein, partial [Candidatus Falkowbacteria bacterium]|nr:FtsX-like permease family protein [Candidatus Falkowbacteria bacterium]